VHLGSVNRRGARNDALNDPREREHQVAPAFLRAISTLRGWHQAPDGRPVDHSKTRSKVATLSEERERAARCPAGWETTLAVSLSRRECSAELAGAHWTPLLLPLVSHRYAAATAATASVAVTRASTIRVAASGPIHRNGNSIESRRRNRKERKSER